MVTTKRCAYGTCKNDSRYPESWKRNPNGDPVKFFHFPGAVRQNVVYNVKGVIIFKLFFVNIIIIILIIIVDQISISLISVLWVWEFDIYIFIIK